MIRSHVLFPLTLFVLFSSNVRAEPDPKPWWSDKVEQALKRAGENREEMVHALQKVDVKQRKSMAFLITNMPQSDLQSLKAPFLLENVQLAAKARAMFPWGKKIPEELFLNNVLPYANVNEARDPWRKQFFEMCVPIVKDCKTPAEAAHKLNSELFKKVKVRYSTKRRIPHQSPAESMEIGMASCTGLSILLSDACRSVCIPARLVGTAQWATVPGNHTWVEIWDDGWHFTGACEADPNGLNRGWFTGRAAQAKKDDRFRAIYAASFRKTSTTFPLVWDLRNKSVFAENVTDRYAQKKKEAPPKPKKLSNEQAARIREAASDYFALSDEKRAKYKSDANLDQWLTQHEDAVIDLVWEAFQKSPIHKEMKEDFDKKQVRFEKHLSPYTVKTVGKRPKNGWPLFIAMHGGGGVPKKVNDSQWKIMQIYYRDQPSVTGYKYLALRAPNDIWNGFYAPYNLSLMDNLIDQFLLFGDVDPDRIHLMGYSHGGYGAFYVGPKMPDHFASIHSSAAAPTRGTISAKSLRNTRFTFMIGENDNAYGRRKLCEEFNQQVQELKKDGHLWMVEMEFKKGHGHGGLPDRDKIKTMYPHVRKSAPHHLTWDLMDSVIRDFYWLHVAEPKNGGSIEAKVKDNQITVTSSKVSELCLCLSGRHVDFSKSLQISHNGEEKKLEIKPSFQTLCDSLMARRDPKMASVVRVELSEKK